jgi:hypothetical protein
MAKMKPGQISAKRAYEISDSLRKRADFDGHWAKATGDLALKEKNQPVKEALLKTSSQGWKDYSRNYEKSDRLKSRADVAMAKANATVGRDTPLPSSEGMMSKITSGLASLFGK